MDGCEPTRDREDLGRGLRATDDAATMPFLTVIDPPCLCAK